MVSTGWRAGAAACLAGTLVALGALWVRESRALQVLRFPSQGVTERGWGSLGEVRTGGSLAYYRRLYVRSYWRVVGQTRLLVSFTVYTPRPGDEGAELSGWGLALADAAEAREFAARAGDRLDYCRARVEEAGDLPEAWLRCRRRIAAAPGRAPVVIDERTLDAYDGHIHAKLSVGLEGHCVSPRAVRTADRACRALAASVGLSWPE